MSMLPGPVGELGRAGARAHARGRGVQIAVGKTDESDWWIVSVRPGQAAAFALRVLWLAALTSVRRS